MVLHQWPNSQKSPSTTSQVCLLPSLRHFLGKLTLTRPLTGLLGQKWILNWESQAIAGSANPFNGLSGALSLFLWKFYYICGKVSTWQGYMTKFESLTLFYQKAEQDLPAPPQGALCKVLGLLTRTKKPKPKPKPIGM
jgi:hypothetical protein